MTKRWHVIECYEGKDKDAYGRLAALGYEVYRPVVEIRASMRAPGTNKIVRRNKVVPIFGRYVFVRVEMSDSVYGAVREQPGVRNWICYAGGDEPAMVPDDLVDFYRAYRAQASEEPQICKVGDAVRIIAGPFVGLTGKVNRVDSRKGVCVELPIFGRLTPLPLPVSLVALVEQGRRPPIERDDHRRQRKLA